MSTATAANSAVSGARALPPVLGRLLSGTFWLALRVPLQVVTAFWSTRLILEAIGPIHYGAYLFAWGFSLFQFLFEFGASSALQRQISDAWTRGDRDGVDRAIACGFSFYTAMASVQVVALLSVAYLGLPYSMLKFSSYPLVVKLLWLQALTAPCFGFSIVISSVLQAARRYDFVPRYELAIILLRFVVLVGGLKAGIEFFWVVAAQTAVQVGLGLGPALWVMVRELGHSPHFRGARWADYKALGHVSVYVALIQISVVLADRCDTTVLGFMLPGRTISGRTEAAITVYGLVSKAFINIRQTGWLLAYLVMPAVASLAAARDDRGLDRVRYDGTRLHLGAILPVGLLAWIYAGPFLALWIRSNEWDAMSDLGYDLADVTGLMRLFLVATIPLILAVPVQMAIGINKIKVIALAALAGSLVNLPISCVLTARLGVEGVIWGTVLTTLFSNLVIPGVYVFDVLKIDPRTFLKRTLSAPLAGGTALILTTMALSLLVPLTPLDGYDLRLMSSASDVSDIPSAGQRLIVVAVVDHVLHYRIFDGDGKVVVDTDEKRLTEHARQIDYLRKQLESLRPPHELTVSEKVRVMTAVTSIVGHTPLDPSLWARALHLLFQLGVGSLGYLGGYLLVPTGRSDLFELTSKLRRR